VTWLHLATADLILAFYIQTLLYLRSKLMRDNLTIQERVRIIIALAIFSWIIVIAAVWGLYKVLKWAITT